MARTSNQRTIFLISYLHVDLKLVPQRINFLRIIQDAFEQTDDKRETKLKHWCCSKQDYRNGYHYHVAVQLNKRRRWKKVQDYIIKHYNIHVHFFNDPQTYYEAWQLCSRCDTNREFILNSDHPNFKKRPTIITRRRRRNMQVKFQIRTMAIKNGITNENEILAIDALLTLKKVQLKF